MKTYLVTGGAGFIGSNFVLYMLEKYKDITIVNVDKLTYAGNLENLKSIEGDKRHVFVQADICDREAITALFGQYDFDFVIRDLRQDERGGHGEYAAVRQERLV